MISITCEKGKVTGSSKVMAFVPNALAKRHIQTEVITSGGHFHRTKLIRIMAPSPRHVTPYYHLSSKSRVPNYICSRVRCRTRITVGSDRLQGFLHGFSVTRGKCLPPFTSPDSLKCHGGVALRMRHNGSKRTQVNCFKRSGGAMISVRDYPLTEDTVGCT